VFFLSQVFQTVFGYSPLASGVRILPWTGMPMLVAPIAGILSDRIGGKWIVTAGLGLQAVALTWIASVMSTSVGYSALLVPFILGGTGMAMFFAPIANLVLGSVRREQEGIASGVNNALREFGGVLGIAVMGAVFSANGGYGPTATKSAGQHFMDGLIPAVFTGAAVLAVATLAMFLVPGRRGQSASQMPQEADAQQEAEDIAQGVGRPVEAHRYQEAAAASA
jgi:MFS family permease